MKEINDPVLERGNGLEGTLLFQVSGHVGIETVWDRKFPCEESVSTLGIGTAAQSGPVGAPSSGPRKM